MRDEAGWFKFCLGSGDNYDKADKTSSSSVAVNDIKELLVATNKRKRELTECLNIEFIEDIDEVVNDEEQDEEEAVMIGSHSSIIEYERI